MLSVTDTIKPCTMIPRIILVLNIFIFFYKFNFHQVLIKTNNSINSQIRYLLRLFIFHQPFYSWTISKKQYQKVKNQIFRQSTVVDIIFRTRLFSLIITGRYLLSDHFVFSARLKGNTFSRLSSAIEQLSHSQCIVILKNL